MTAPIRSVQEDKPAGHTPGPWNKVRGELVGRGGEKVVEYGSGLAIMCGGSPLPEHIANARLIAAAPCLFEALEAVLNHSGARGPYHAMRYADAVEQAEAAISKALPRVSE